MKKLFLLIILLLILSGCGDSKRHEFSGSSENWHVVYVVEISSSDRQQTTGIIEYLGDETVPKTIDYEIATLLTSLNSTGKSLTDGKANIGTDNCDGCAVIKEDEEIEVEIAWDGQTEKFILKNTK